MDWVDFDDGVFARAAREDRLVLLSVGAGWCHWCHVMDEETWADPEVEARVAAHFVAVRVDQDARPDLSLRYEDWGWPATVILAADGTELAKLRGFLPPGRMVGVLDAFLADPTPGPSAMARGDVPRDREALLARWDGVWDREAGGWGTVTKQLDWPSVALALSLGDAERVGRAKQTVRLQRKLVDPVWGGAYQYSDSGDWDHPHFEKIVPIQADDLRAFALAWAWWGEPEDRAAALAIARYVDDFLWDPAGGYRASQDADVVAGEHAGAYFARDDAGRRALGVPRVDPRRYARENGLLAAALADASGWLGEPALLADAERAALWAMRERGLPGGLFSHEADDVAGPWLADTLAMGEAFVALHDATADPMWLDRARDAVRAIDGAFREDAGYRAAADAERIPGAEPLVHREENARLVVLADAVADRAGDARAKAVAERAWTHVAAVSGDGPAAPVLLADLARARPALGVAIGGPPGAELAPFYAAARALPVVDRHPHPADPARFPPPSAPTAWVCSAYACSSPVRDPAQLAAAARALLRDGS